MSATEDREHEPNQNQGVSRRTVLQGAVGLLFLDLMAGCQSQTPATPSPTALPTPSPAPAPTATLMPAVTPTSVVVPYVEPAPGPNYVPWFESNTHVIFDLCIRDGACAEVCPVECIVPGYPEEEWPWYYVDPDTCIACGACVPECPMGAVLPAGELLPEHLPAIEKNALFFSEGPGYGALDGG